MGKGDKKTKRGKIVIGSYGVRRAKKSKIASMKTKAPVISPIVKDKKIKAHETVVHEVVVEEPVTVIHEITDEVTITKEKSKKTAKKTTAKKPVEKADKEEPKSKTTKTKKKEDASGEDLFTAKAEDSNT